MPKVGMEPIRKKQLIDATLVVIAEYGFHSATISLISKQAGLSSGIISHYFGGKQGLIEAAMRYLLEKLKLQGSFTSHLDRIDTIVESNFSVEQQESSATNTWLNFWALSLHNEGLHRLQRINHKRLESNLTYSFTNLIPREHAKEAALSTAALIDGFWLRNALEGEKQNTKENVTKASNAVKRYVRLVVSQYQ